MNSESRVHFLPRKRRGGTLCLTSWGISGFYLPLGSGEGKKVGALVKDGNSRLERRRRRNDAAAAAAAAKRFSLLA